MATWPACGRRVTTSRHRTSAAPRGRANRAHDRSVSATRWPPCEPECCTRSTPAHTVWRPWKYWIPTAEFPPRRKPSPSGAARPGTRDSFKHDYPFRGIESRPSAGADFNAGSKKKHAQQDIAYCSGASRFVSRRLREAEQPQYEPPPPEVGVRRRARRTACRWCAKPPDGSRPRAPPTCARASRACCRSAYIRKGSMVKEGQPLVHHRHRAVSRAAGARHRQPRAGRSRRHQRQGHRRPQPRAREAAARVAHAARRLRGARALDRRAGVRRARAGRRPRASTSATPTSPRRSPAAPARCACSKARSSGRARRRC